MNRYSYKARLSIKQRFTIQSESVWAAQIALFNNKIYLTCLFISDIESLLYKGCVALNTLKKSPNQCV